MAKIETPKISIAPMVDRTDKYFPGGEVKDISRREIIERYIPYAEKEEEKGASPSALLRHILGLFYGKKGSKVWKQIITPPYESGDSVREILNKALMLLPQDVLEKRL